MTHDELRRRIQSTHFFQRFSILGIETPGRQDITNMLPHLGLPGDLSGKSVLDIGACDGAMSFLAESRGASRVVAMEHPDWGAAGWGVRLRDGFDLAHEALNSRVEPVTCRVEDLTPEKVGGTFDIVLFLGVLYHLEDILGGLKRAASVLAPGGLLVVETLVDCLDVPYPAMRPYEPGEAFGDPTNTFGPNPAAVVTMMKRVGLVDVRHLATFRPSPGSAMKRGSFQGRTKLLQ